MVGGPLTSLLALMSRPDQHVHCMHDIPFQSTDLQDTHSIVIGGTPHVPGYFWENDHTILSSTSPTSVSH